MVENIKCFKNAQKPFLIEKKKLIFFIPILGKKMLKTWWISNLRGFINAISALYRCS